jgi:hypothetical protein
MEQPPPGVDPKHPAMMCPGSLITEKPKIAVVRTAIITSGNSIWMASLFIIYSIE